MKRKSECQDKQSKYRKYENVVVYLDSSAPPKCFIDKMSPGKNEKSRFYRELCLAIKEDDFSMIDTLAWRVFVAEILNLKYRPKLLKGSQYLLVDLFKLHDLIPSILNKTKCLLEKSIVYDLNSHSKELVIEYVRRMPSAYRYLSDETASDIDVILAACENLSTCDGLFSYMPEKCRNDRQIVLLLLDNGVPIPKEVIGKYLSDREVVLRAAHDSDLLICYFGELKHDREICEISVRISPKAVVYMTESMRNDEEMALLAIEHHPIALAHLPARLTNDKTFLLKAIKRNPRSIYFASIDMQQDREIAQFAIRNGCIIRQPSYEFANNREFILEAVSHCGGTLELACEELRADEEIVKKAVKTRGLAIRYASRELRNNKKIALSAVKQDAHSYLHISDELKRDFDIISQSIQNNPLVLMAMKHMLDDRDFITNIICIHIDVFEYIPDRFKSDKEIVLKAINAYPGLISKIEGDLIYDIDILYIANKII